MYRGSAAAISRASRTAPFDPSFAGELPEGAVVVAVLADGGWKYLSGDFWDADDVEESMESTLWW